MVAKKTPNEIAEAIESSRANLAKGKMTEKDKSEKTSKKKTTITARGINKNEKEYNPEGFEEIFIAISNSPVIRLRTKPETMTALAVSLLQALLINQLFTGQG